MQCYRTSQVGGRASQVGGIASIIKVNESNLEPSGTMVIRPIMNIKLKILELKILVLKIKHHTYSSSSEYKLSTGKQLQGLGTMTSYKLFREVRKQGSKEFSQRWSHN